MLKAQITTAADVSCLLLLFLKKQQNLKLSSAANFRWRFITLRCAYAVFDLNGPWA